MKKKVDDIFFKYLCSPGKIGPVEMRNRITMAPMGSSFGGTNGAVTDRVVDWYEARAKGGTGLITVENTFVVPASKYGAHIPNELQIWDRNLVSGWKMLTDACHYWGAKIAVQINYPGAGVDPQVWPGVQPAAPSVVALPGYIVPVLTRELPIEEILWLEDQYALGATCAREAGFDMVQLHCVHGYGIAGFNSKLQNKRNDIYGGSFENRMRFGLNIIRKVKAVIGPDMALAVRIPVDEMVPGGADKEECIRMAQAYEAAGVDAIQLSCGTVGSIAETIQPSYYPRAFLKPYLSDMRKAVKVPLTVAGGFADPADAESVLNDYGVDFIDLGRVLIGDAEWANKVMEGRPEDIRRCLRCNTGCIHSIIETHSGLDCAINIEVGRERRLKITPAETPKKVLVIGGGPGGMEAARVAALRGHDVTLYEKSDKLGGNIRAAGASPFKVEFLWLIDWFATQLNKLGVEVQMGRMITPDDVEKIKPDVVIVATGAQEIIPDDIVGTDKAVTAVDVLLDKVKVSKNVVIVGGQLTGCETGLNLAQKGHSVLILKRRPGDIATNTDLVVNRKVLVAQLQELNVKWLTGRMVTEIDDDGVRAVDITSGKIESYSADTTILAPGLQSVTGLEDALRDKVPEVYSIGDCVKPRIAKDAIHEGSIIARRI